MSSQDARINKGINGLVQRLLATIPGEDIDATNERRSNAVEFARELLERYLRTQTIFCVRADKAKVMQENRPSSQT
jgi:hypothetical protein